MDSEDQTTEPQTPASVNGVSENLTQDCAS